MGKNKFKKEDVEPINSNSAEVKPVEETIIESEAPKVEPVEEKLSGLIEIEITKEVAGMAIGTKKTVPVLLAKQMIEKGNAKQITK